MTALLVYAMLRRFFAYYGPYKHLFFSLSDGLGTSVGERGLKLSGGQKQRLGTASPPFATPIASWSSAPNQRSHAELLVRHGAYARLHGAQFGSHAAE